VTEIKPTRPVPRGGAAGFVAGRYKVEPDDFVVEELPAYEPSGHGEHAWLWIEKRGVSTLDLALAVGRALGVDPRGVGIAGLKDARAVSRQWLSVAGVEDAQVAGLAGEGWRVLAHSRHGNKLKMGHLRGNRFVVTLRGTGPDDLAAVQQNLAELQRRGVPNYFGEQRFGKRGANLEKGLAILRGQARRAARTVPRRVFGLLVSAVQSEVFNRVVIARLQTLDVLLPGDLAYLHRNGACFPVVDAAAEQPRAAAFELSPSGPMPGPKMTPPAGEPLAIEQRALAAMDLAPSQFAALPFGMARGERRPLRVPLHDAEARAHQHGLELRFALPRGSFATSVLRELLTDTIWFEQRA
jgi:tRNA pseudouridine13 synthase